ncbi:MAG: exodeoxyribonuclease III [Rhodocyclaceae bacterium]|jgi:exodeoxyribonuclease-3|nr:exodeoxyribonuclease III [Rhodocyclaceae bacterium]MCE2722376.1 exodeoxyribonuclease III [Betaproteobacteria bacterium]MCA3023925.1 exodeoxyribonuclease III [Rhodocyclaceae bacterium]MCA3030711.1 exodeoxyribonuclease III [Rhodocyclaceae bacterium]MCA3036141.1 exodeoxyribonuclease III [Rhodocyclaceae bacterium]
MKLATWNINSLNVRLPHVLEWLKTSPVDVLCLQELKLEDAKFPLEAIEDAGYHAVFNGQKTYNGVAILSRSKPEDVAKDMPGYADEQKRVIAATIDGVRVVNVYIVNGQSLDSEKYQYKMAWLTALRGYMANAIAEFGDVALLGDYNIAPEDRDVHDPKAWEGQVLVSVPERKHFEALIALGLVDSFRLFKQAEKSFTWWDYRMNGFKRNLGLRIDHILLTKNLAAETKGSVIDVEPRKLERPSDHTPVISTIRA